MANAIGVRSLLVGAALATIAGCAGTGRDVHQFSPLPKATIGAESLAAVEPRSVTELLRDAESAFDDANAAQEEGDHSAALRHYSRMLELLIEADLDPAIFYSLRGEFENILSTSTEQAEVYDYHWERVIKPGDYEHIAGFSALEIPFPLPERVLKEIEWIQEGWATTFQRGLDRSYAYLPYIRAEFQKAGLPPELCWLPMVESSFMQRAVSHAGATGMWQFMRTTGQRYNLRVDGHVDQRYDWQRSTHAAIAYLKDLYQYFDGNWALAVSAYNMGEGGLERAIAGNGGETNLWVLLDTPPAANRIPRETKKYYARLLAVAIVASNPERYGFTRNPSPPLRIVRVPVEGSFSLSRLDEALELPPGTMEQLNPDLIRQRTPSTGTHHVAVPLEKRTQFAQVIRDLPSEQVQLASTGRGGPAPGGTHIVRRGETLSKIAQRYDVPMRELMAANDLRSAHQLKAGQRLKVPGEDAPAPAPKAAPAPATTAPAVLAGNAKTHTVQRGDTLYDVAQAHGTSVSKLQEWNGIASGQHLAVGQRLVVADPNAVPATHSVRAGESPSVIAARYGVRTDDLLAWNGLDRGSVISVGQTLRLAPVAQASPAAGAPAPRQTVEHTVARGETASTIAARYGIRTSDLLAANSLTARSTLHVGQDLRVPDPKKTPGGTAPAPQPQAPTTHTVAAGESPSVIAAKHGINTRHLLAWNGLDAGSVLQIGQELKLSGGGGSTAAQPAPAPQAPSGATLTHTVAAGESPYTIARKYGVKTSDVLAWNGLTPQSTLQIGQQLTIEKRDSGRTQVASNQVASNTAAAQPAPQRQAVVHTVAAGHNPTTIARRYGVRVSQLYQWNDWPQGHVLYPGDKVTVYTD